MLKSIRDFFDFLIGIVLPYRNDYDIVRKLNFTSISNLPIGSDVQGYPWITALFQYKNHIVRAIIWELKYKGTILPLESIGKLLHDQILETISEILLSEPEARFVLIPIPISTERRAERGYNQSEYIARSIKAYDAGNLLLYAPQWFEKIKETPKQSKSQSKMDRMNNLTQCFKASEHVSGKYIILIDDVVTTGSTLVEARNTLLSADARDVYAFTIAH